MIWMTDGRVLLTEKQADALLALLEASVQVVTVTCAEQRQNEDVVEVRLLEAVEHCIDAGVRRREGITNATIAPGTR